jgi:hypothetical protein
MAPPTHVQSETFANRMPQGSMPQAQSGNFINHMRQGSVPSSTTAVRIPEEGSRGPLDKYLTSLPPKQSGSSSSSAPKPRHEGEFDLDRVQVAPGEAVGDWNDLITNIKSTADQVADEYDEADTVIPGFDPQYTLRPWQVQGRHWMLRRESDGKRGGILADDVSPSLLLK